MFGRTNTFKVFGSMSGAIEKIEILCENCGNLYEDWYRPSLNSDLENFDKDYLDEASSAVCPKCNFKVFFDTLTVKDRIFCLGRSNKPAK